LRIIRCESFPHLVLSLIYIHISLQTADVTEPTPKNLYMTAAILIREGFITLEDLYPHLK
jgi:hypothetical protein